MKKISTLVFFAALAYPFFAFAQLRDLGPGVDIRSVVQGAQTAAWIVFTAVAVIMFVVAGILFLTAHGEPEKIKTARSAVIWGVAGVIVGIAAFSIIGIVGSFL